MNKYIFSKLMLLIVFMFHQNVIAEPSRLFFQETAYIESNDSISLDLDYPFNSHGATAGLRMGAFDGVILINSHTETGSGTRMGFIRPNAGFKKIIQKNLAAYAVLSYYADENDSDLDLALGLAYTVKSGTFTYNINPELITDRRSKLRGLQDTIFIKGAIMVPLSLIKKGKASVIVEINLENNKKLDTIFNFGFRWQPRKDITLDFILYSDRGNIKIFNSGNNTTVVIEDNEKGIPGWIKVNIQF